MIDISGDYRRVADRCGGLWDTGNALEGLDPACFSLTKPPQEWSLCAALITTVEFFSGVVLNLWLGWNIWDYSGMRINLLGQICPAFCLVWLGISIPGVWLCRLLRVLVT